MSKPYSVRKMGTRRGVPHYGADCNLCRSVLAVAYLSRDAAIAIAKAHVAREHGR